MDNHKTCQGYIDLDKRVSIVETKMDGMEDNIAEIKQNQKDARFLTMTTLISSLLGLIGIIYSLLGA